MYLYKALHSGLSASEEADALGQVLELDGSPKPTLAVRFKEQDVGPADDAQRRLEDDYWADLPRRERCSYELDDMRKARAGSTCACAPRHASSFVDH